MMHQHLGVHGSLVLMVHSIIYCRGFPVWGIWAYDQLVSYCSQHTDKDSGEHEVYGELFPQGW